MSNFRLKKDKVINGLNSYYFVDKCQQSDNLTLEQRKNKVNELLNHDYWTSYYDHYNDARGNKDDYLAEQSSVELNLEKMASYLIFHKDSEKLIKQTNYVILKNQKAFDEYIDKEDMSNFSKDTIVTYLENKQYYLEKTNKFKKAMLNAPITCEYKKFYGQLSDFDNTYVGVRTRLIEEKNDLIAENKVLSSMLWDEVKDRASMCPIKKAKLHTRIADNKSKINENIKKIKTILFWYSKYKRLIEEDVLLLEQSIRPLIYFKHVESYVYNADILDFFDYFDVVDGFTDFDLLELLVKVGSTDEKENMMYELLFDNSVYENNEAMDVIRKLINYYLDEIITDEHERLIFDMWRNGISQTKIAEIVSSNKQMTKMNVSHIISKVLRNIAKKHIENVNHVYDTTKLKSTLKTCNVCGHKLPKTFFDNSYSTCKKCTSSLKVNKKTCRKCGSEKLPTQFSKDKRNSDGLHVWCKDCRKEHMSKKRESSDL